MRYYWYGYVPQSFFRDSTSPKSFSPAKALAQPCSGLGTSPVAWVHRQQSHHFVHREEKAYDLRGVFATEVLLANRLQRAAGRCASLTRSWLATGYVFVTAVPEGCMLSGCNLKL